MPDFDCIIDCQGRMTGSQQARGLRYRTESKWPGESGLIRSPSHRLTMQIKISLICTMSDQASPLLRNALIVDNAGVVQRCTAGYRLQNGKWQWAALAPTQVRHQWTVPN